MSGGKGVGGPGGREGKGPRNTVKKLRSASTDFARILVHAPTSLTRAKTHHDQQQQQQQKQKNKRGREFMVY